MRADSRRFGFRSYEKQTDLISVIVGTFGHDSWKVKAIRAIDSVFEQTVKPRELIQVHETSLAKARNRGAEDANGEWLLFLDADDALDSAYIEAMERAATPGPSLLQPSHVNSKDRPTGLAGVVSMIPARPIKESNFLIIGTLVRRDQFLRVGGFRDLPLYEDWDLWIRCFEDGAKHVKVPDAIYEIEVNEGNRNDPSRDVQVAVANQIRETYR